MHNKKIVPSEQTQQEAMKVALATQKPGQTKEQTKLIAQGIEKGIALYKKQHKEKHRQIDKAKKKAQQRKPSLSIGPAPTVANRDMPETVNGPLKWLPWGLLIISWLGFIIYIIR
ncbi:DUF2956 domain-containing protein [Vibrio aestuarianus]|uniref:DUF2956 domain-containing protein n=1 Tax=Vibrio aestuarianus TaxID=28171 RepID=A0A9X4FF60_9VIBR|nr:MULTISPECIES: DUF2956 domain-containing protein [Vibrio]KOE80471.1 membrane protein [Vibrio alginolyticus]MDE1221176.1 DUF2956 domain-containing protein [Vibrio aestuarianus]MDE1230543.1 DUF2956 domain-containing protein [Vibrio aestuarianus]MDE1234520.1 DUF2956 domain-containing protein [Vibrio aestuarianus]MDE1241034.1 DUF2956 domain-containing protein [Vibrio aestuarianus]